MNHKPDGTHEVDSIARRLHAAAVAQVTPRTLAQLRAGRVGALAPTTPIARPVLGWTLAVAIATVFAVAVGLGLNPAGSDAVDQSPAVADADAGADDSSDSLYGEAMVSLDEDPDFYFWLATTDVQPLAME